jgi:hypothetical protein
MRCLGGWRWRVGLAVALALAVTGPAAAATTFEAEGRVTAVHPTRNAVTLEHLAIPGLLPATRSEFPVASGGVLRGVRPGDRVRFTLAAADESHGLLTVAALAPDAGTSGWLDRTVALAAAALAIVALAVTVGVGVVLWRTLQVLHHRVVALDHEAGTLRGVVTNTQDTVHQIARALEETALTLRLGYVRELRRRFVSGSRPAGTESRAPAEAAGTLVIVQRGRGELYQAVESGGAGPGCKVIWDRRRGDRRTGARRPVGHERRRAERRVSLPETWSRLGFHIVAGGHADASRSAHPPRSAGGERSATR